MSENSIKFEDWSYEPKEGTIEHCCTKGCRIIFYLQDNNHKGVCWGCHNEIPKEIIFLNLIK